LAALLWATASAQSRPACKPLPTAHLCIWTPSLVCAFSMAK
jgi:hypothetical protein